MSFLANLFLWNLKIIPFALPVLVIAQVAIFATCGFGRPVYWLPLAAILLVFAYPVSAILFTR